MTDLSEPPMLYPPEVLQARGMDATLSKQQHKLMLKLRSEATHVRNAMSNIYKQADDDRRSHMPDAEEMDRLLADARTAFDELQMALPVLREVLRRRADLYAQAWGDQS